MTWLSLHHTRDFDNHWYFMHTVKKQVHYEYTVFFIYLLANIYPNKKTDLCILMLKTRLQVTQVR